MNSRHFIALLLCLALLACGQSYEETKQLTRQQHREAQRKDSAALKVAVMPTLDCLPLYVARYYQLYDTLRGGVRLKFYTAQMDCDTAMLRGRVEGSITDLVRAKRMEQRGLKLRYVAGTNTYWQLLTNRNARIHQLKQLDDKMVAMTRYSATDMLTNMVVDSAKLKDEHVFRVQINDVNVRLLMLVNNEMDALWLTEPYATAARVLKHTPVMDTRQLDLQLGVLAFRELEMRRQARAQQLQLFVKAYNQACDSINRYGVRRYVSLISEYNKLRSEWLDSVPNDLKFEHAQGPRQRDVAAAEKWCSRQ